MTVTEPSGLAEITSKSVSDAETPFLVTDVVPVNSTPAEYGVIVDAVNSQRALLASRTKTLSPPDHVMESL